MGHPLGQRQSVRISRPGKAFAPLALVDPTRYQRATDRPRPSRTERRPRTDAPHTQGPDHTNSRVNLRAPTAALRLLSPRVQQRASARGARAETAGDHLRPPAPT